MSPMTATVPRGAPVAEFLLSAAAGLGLADRAPVLYGRDARLSAWRARRPGTHGLPLLPGQSGLYLNNSIVTYRIRYNSISNSPWPRERIYRYEHLWETFRNNLILIQFRAAQRGCGRQCAVPYDLAAETNNTPPIEWDAVITVTKAVFATGDQFVYEYKLYEFLGLLHGP